MEQIYIFLLILIIILLFSCMLFICICLWNYLCSNSYKDKIEIKEIDNKPLHGTNLR